MRKTFVRVLWGLLCASVVFVAIAFTSIWFGWVGYMPDIADLQNPISRYASQVYSVDGRLVKAQTVGDGSQIDLASGLYIVRAAGKSVKVAVR